MPPVQSVAETSKMKVGLAHNRRLFWNKHQPQKQWASEFRFLLNFQDFSLFSETTKNHRFLMKLL